MQNTLENKIGLQNKFKLMNKKIGILFCGYNTEEYVKQSLSSFIGRENFIISAVSVPFSEYADQDDFEDETTNILRGFLDKGDIHNLVTAPRFISEADARNLALNYLTDQKVDYIWLVDADEIYTDEDIDNICKFVESDSVNFWWRLCLKNFVFDKHIYMKEPFTPPRIYRTEPAGFKHPLFYWDNDISFVDMVTFDRKGQEQLPNSTIPKEVAWVDHYSWLSDTIGKRKVDYQQAHFGHCSFKWDEEQNCLQFDESYFEKTGEQKPELVSDQENVFPPYEQTR